MRGIFTGMHDRSVMLMRVRGRTLAVIDLRNAKPQFFYYDSLYTDQTAVTGMQCLEARVP